MTLGALVYLLLFQAFGAGSVSEAGLVRGGALEQGRGGGELAGSFEAPRRRGLHHVGALGSNA